VKRLLFTLIACILSLTGFGGSSARAEGAVDAVTLRIEPTNSSLTLGENLDLRIGVTNNGARPSPPLVIHLDITDPDRSSSVDPEDWTPTLSKVVGVVAPGDTVIVAWNIQPISSGTFATYAVALSPGIDDLATSNVLQVAVADQRTLNPGGILFVAIGAPALVGALLLLQIRLARRTRSRPDVRAAQSE
jgi:hypothetical protein